MTAEGHILPDGRLHLHHGPMDLIVQAWGERGAVAAAYRRAWARFAPLLDELVAELPALRSPADLPVRGPVAGAMAAAVRPFRPAFITPMAAVAGAVADEVLAHLAGPGIDRAYVNNGGDIALLLAPGASLTAAIAVRADLPDRVTIRHGDPVRGIATSGWGGRSFSLGIADAVTVLAPTAAMADAAATVIANAVDLPGHPAIRRLPACEVKADSDLGAIPVTVAVGPLAPAGRAAALAAGDAAARAARKDGLIAGAALFLQGEARFVPAHYLSGNIPGGVRGGQRPPRRIAAAGGDLAIALQLTEHQSA
ncbi:MAG: UPF0280 family protein [Proteobacteria bacterium]|nr:UPF0280 family protein [Pseudomonadota bacterium]MBS0573463.1 UPF0280 family protein [Pseudomonadota bacterium]